MKKAGDTFLYVRCSVRVCRAPSRPCLERDLTPATTAIYDRGEPSYNRTATLDRIAQYLSLWCGSAALKPQILEPPGPLLLQRWAGRYVLLGVRVGPGFKPQLLFPVANVV